tara:strand:+ start:261 stop:563 length:303 start_codon:yes stop_codon:yes gene_type:complete
MQNQTENVMLKTFYYTIEFSHSTYTGEVEKESHEAALDYAELIIVDQIAKDYGWDWNEAAEWLEKIGETTISLVKPAEKQAVLYNMLTGEKTFGPAGSQS